MDPESASLMRIRVQGANLIRIHADPEPEHWSKLSLLDPAKGKNRNKASKPWPHLYWWSPARAYEWTQYAKIGKRSKIYKQISSGCPFHIMRNKLVPGIPPGPDHLFDGKGFDWSTLHSWRSSYSCRTLTVHKRENFFGGENCCFPRITEFFFIGKVFGFDQNWGSYKALAHSKNSEK